MDEWMNETGGAPSGGGFQLRREPLFSN